MQPRYWIPGLLTLILAVPASAVPAPDRIAWRFEKGKTFYQSMTTEIAQTIKIMGMDITQKQNQVFVFGWTPVRHENDGSWVFRQKIEAVAMSIQIGGSTIDYDSTGPNADNPLNDFFKALVGVEFLVTLDRNLRVTKVEGREEFVKKLGDANVALKPLLESILSEGAIKQMADPAFGAVPSKPVKKGDTWHKESRLSMGAIGGYKTKYSYTYEGPEGRLERVSVRTDMTYEAPDAKSDGGGLPFKIKSADLKTTNASGLLVFNPDKGRVERSEMRLELKGKMSVEIGGATTELDLQQTQITTVKTSDKLPGGGVDKDK